VLLASSPPVTVSAASDPSSASASPGPGITRRVLDRGPHHRLIETQQTILDKSGKSALRTGRYTEVRNGMHYWSDGDWVDSEGVIEGYPGGATAVRGPYKVIFANNLNNPAGGVDLLTPDNVRLRVKVRGLAWRDAATGQTQWIGSVRDSQGVILPPNQVLYESAFEGLEAAVRYTYTAGAFEQDVILAEAPQLPNGFAPESSHLEVWTWIETSASPEVLWHSSSSRNANRVSTSQQPAGLDDCLIDFGNMQVVRGRAFALGLAEAPVSPSHASAPVFKRWQAGEGGGLLVESVDYQAMRAWLEHLPPRQAKAEPSPVQGTTASAALQPPASMRVAVHQPATSGVVIDFILVYSQQYYTFATDQTYKIASAVDISKRATFQAGAIVKFTDHGSLTVQRHVTSPDPLTPRAVLTHFDDNSIGEPLGDNQVTTRYPFALLLDTLGVGETIRRLEIRYAQTGMDFYYCNDPTVRDCIWRDCDTGIRAAWTAVTLDELFMCDVTTPTENAGSASFSGVETIVTDCSEMHKPVITVQPGNQAVAVGGAATFSVTATGYGLTYRWYFNNASIPGANAPVYARNNMQHADAGQYHVVVANDVGEAKSAKATLTVSGPPAITLQPASQVGIEGQAVTFTVGALGNPPFAYQWYFNNLNNPIPGATSYKLELQNLDWGDEGWYRVRVSSNGQHTYSASALLTVKPTCEWRVYTTSQDFDNGVLVNLNHDTPGELRLNSIPKPLPYVNMACSERGTIVRIDANSGVVIGEYRTAVEVVPNPPFEDTRIYSNPSRTAVDRFGNVWVGNRSDNWPFNGVRRGSVTRIGVVVGGIRGDRNGSIFTPNPAGEYLSPPFVYNTCLDRDGDGLIRTSRGLGNVLPWPNASGLDTDGGTETAEDEAIVNYVRVAGEEVRLVAVDGNNDLWTGGWTAWATYEKLSGTTGLPVGGTQFQIDFPAYGGFVDGSGLLWSSAGDSWRLLRYEPTSNPPCCILQNSDGRYGLAIDPTTQDIWHTDRLYGKICLLNQGGLNLASFYHGAADSQGVAVDASHNVWVAHCYQGTDPASQLTVGHVRTDQAKWIGNVHLSASPNIKPGPTGVSIDANGKAWVSNFNANNAMRIDPDAGPYSSGGVRIGAVDLTVDLGDGTGHQPPHDQPAHPYNYSDMTGYQYLGATSQSGCWVVVHDGQAPDKNWNKLSWSANTPPGTQILVEVRAANTLASLPGTGQTPRMFQLVSNGQTFGGVTGRYLEVRVTLLRPWGAPQVPALYDLTVYCPTT